MSGLPGNVNSGRPIQALAQERMASGAFTWEPLTLSSLIFSEVTSSGTGAAHPFGERQKGSMIQL